MILCKMNMPEAEHDELRSALLEAFGGYTVTYGTGGWRDEFGEDHTDLMAVYEVAMDATRENFDRFVEIATDFAIRLGEKAVYYVIDGEPEIVDLTGAPSGSVYEPPQHTREETWGDYFKTSPALYDMPDGDGILDDVAKAAKEIREATPDNFAKYVALGRDEPPVDYETAFTSWFEEAYPHKHQRQYLNVTGMDENIRAAFIAGRKS